MTGLLLVLALGTGVAAFWLTGRVRHYAIARDLLDHPNQRSSHVTATPRGGGMAIVVTTIAALLLAGALDLLPWRVIWAFTTAGTLVAAIGFIDDHGHLARRWRLLAHLVAAAGVLAGLGWLPPLPVFGSTLEPGWAGQVLAVLYVAWLINLTNFMDGIDGIAAVEVVSVCLAAVLLQVATVPGTTLAVTPVILSAATLGFLAWNWPPARIFMGDGGSGFLGLMLAALSLHAAATAPELFWSWVILLGVFITDATVTLVRRLARGDTVYEAHRTHAYQHAAQRWRAHRPVTLAVAAVNLCWLFPIARLVATGALPGPIGIAVAYVPLAAAAFWLGAGAPPRPRARAEAPNV